MTEAEQTTAETTEAAPEPSIEELAAKLFKADEEPAVSSSADDSAAAPSGESPAEPAAAEPAPEPAPDPRVAQRIAIAKRAEIRIAQERAEMKAQREAIERANAELEAKLARFKLLEEDPVRAFDELKLDPKSFIERLAGEQDPTNVIARQVASLQAELKAEREARERMQRETEQRTMRARSDQAWQEASKGFVEFVGEQADKYPHLVAEYTEGEAISAAERALSEVVGHDDQGRPVTRVEAYKLEFGDYPDNDVIAEYLDQQAKARAEARQKSAWRRGSAAPDGSQPIPNGDPKPAAPQVSRGTSPRTLTSRVASEKASAPRQWSQEAADEESLKILQGAFKHAG